MFDIRLDTGDRHRYCDRLIDDSDDVRVFQILSTSKIIFIIGSCWVKA